MRPCYIKLSKNTAVKRSQVAFAGRHCEMLGITLENNPEPTDTYFIIGEDNNCWFSITSKYVSQHDRVSFNSFMEMVRKELDEGHSSKKEIKYSVGKSYSNGVNRIDVVGINDGILKYRVNGSNSIHADRTSQFDFHGFKEVESKPKKVVKKKRAKKSYVAANPKINIGGMDCQSIVNPEAYYADEDSQEDKYRVPVNLELSTMAHIYGLQRKLDESDGSLRKRIEMVREHGREFKPCELAWTSKGDDTQRQHEDNFTIYHPYPKESQSQHEEAELALLPQKVEKELPIASANMMWNADFGYKTKLL